MSREGSVVALAGLLALGVLAAGFADSLPEFVRAPSALFVLLALPGYLLSRVIPAPLAASGHHSALRLSLGFVLWLCALALWTTGFTIAGASFRAYAVSSTWALVSFFAAFAALTARRGGGRSPAPVAWAGWLLIAACAVFAAANPPALTVEGDGLDHIGYVRRVLTEDTLRPAGVLSLPADASRAWPDPRKGALHPVLALASWISSSDPVATWRWLGAVMFPAAVLSLLAFNASFLASRAMRIAAAALVLFSFDGSPFRFAAASAHGETVAAMWAWVLTALVIAAPSGVRWYHWMLLSAGGVLVHLGVAWHVLVLAATIAAFGGAWNVNARGRPAMVASLVAGVALALLIRRDDLAGGANVMHAHTQGVMFVSNGFFIASPMEVLRQYGMIFLGGLVCVPFLLIRARADARAVLVAAAIPFAVSFLPWMATWFYAHGSYMVFRSLLQVPAIAALVMTAGAIVSGVRARNFRALLIGLPVAVLWTLVFLRPVPMALVNEIRAKAGSTRGASPATSDLVRMVSTLPSGCVILSDPATSYVLGAYTSQRFVAAYEQHATPRDPLALERLEAARDVLSPYAVPDVAASACRRFGVNYVLVNRAPPREASDFLSVWRPQTYAVAVRRLVSTGAAFTLVDSTRDASLFRFNPDGVVGRAWSAQDQPVQVGVPALAACSIEAPDGTFEVTGIAVSPARALPGDTVQVTLGYRHDAISRFALPSLVHVRFDHEMVTKSADFPGAKQWRRFADGRSGVRSRFREDLRPGHGVYEPDLWPVGFDLFETFRIVIPGTARMGDYRVEVSVARQTLLPNFHARDLLFNRDHYSGRACASFAVVEHVTSQIGQP